jgi:phosphonate transport system substrate-binding protein
VRQRVLAAMAKMSADPAQRKLLEAIGFNGFEAARDQDWDDVRRLGIRPADAQIQE